MVDPDEIEQLAMRKAGCLGGAYLESLSSTDFAEATKEQWDTFVQTICGGYVTSLIELRMSADDAMRKVEQR